MSTPNVLRRCGYRQTGISLIELVIFIVIVSVGVAGILSVMNVTNSHSADPMLRKQALAIAESLLEEIELQPFTFCDPDDPAAATAAGTAGCSGAAQVEGRYAEPFFDNVADYNGFTMNPVQDINNIAVAGLGTYTPTVTITQAGAGFALPADDVLRIDVNVAYGNDDITLTGYRFRYAPNAMP